MKRERKKKKQFLMHSKQNKPKLRYIIWKGVMIITTVEKYVRHFRKWKTKQNLCLEQRLSQRSEVLMGRIYRLTELTLWAKEKALAQGGQNKISYKEQVPKVLVWKLSLSCKLGRSNKMSEKKRLSHERKKAKDLMIDNEKKKTFGKLSTQKYINTI